MTGDTKRLEYIPKIIHQSYPKAKLTDILSDNIASIQKINPGWEYRFYEDEDCERFIRTNYVRGIFEAYSKINPVYSAARADLFRYLLILKYGGVWLDIKSSTSKPLDDVLLEDDYLLLSQWQNRITEPFEGWGFYPDLNKISGGEFQQWHIISAPQSPFIKAVIKRVMYNISNYTPEKYGTGKYGVVKTTGPIAYTLAINRIRHKHRHRFVEVGRDLGLIYSVYDEPMQHVSTFDNHYSRHSEPVILA